jgi:hypothetical protein
MVRELNLRWPSLGQKDTSLVLEKWSREDPGEILKIHPPKDEIQQIYQYAISNGLEDEKGLAGRIGIHSERGLQVRAVVLLIALPSLKTLNLTQDHQLPHFDALFIKLVRQQQPHPFLPNLTKFFRMPADRKPKYHTDTRPIALSHIVPGMLAPSIETVRVIWGLRAYVPTRSLDLRDLLVNKSLRRSSSIRTLDINASRIDAPELEMILEFTKNLRTLYIMHPWDFHRDEGPSGRPHFNSVLNAVKTHTSHSLEALHFSDNTFGWRMDGHSRTDILCSFVQLKVLSVHIDMLLGRDAETVGDVQSLLPATLENLCVSIEVSREGPHRATLVVQLIDGIINAKVRGEISLEKFESDWKDVDQQELRRLNRRATDAGISLLMTGGLSPYSAKPLFLDEEV